MDVEYFHGVVRCLVEYFVGIPDKRRDPNTRTLFDFLRAPRPFANALQYSP
jgi:hypothetical protein